MLGRLHELADAAGTFAFETTLASRFYAGWLKELQEKGYRVSLVFLWLENVELAIERVRERVRMGGHDIQEETIRRRYERGLNNLFSLYLPVVNSWRVFNASVKRPIEIARFSADEGEITFDEALWRKIRA